MQELNKRKCRKIDDGLCVVAMIKNSKQSNTVPIPTRERAATFHPKSQPQSSYAKLGAKICFDFSLVAGSNEFTCLSFCTDRTCVSTIPPYPYKYLFVYQDKNLYCYESVQVVNLYG